MTSLFLAPCESRYWSGINILRPLFTHLVHLPFDLAVFHGYLARRCETRFPSGHPDPSPGRILQCHHLARQEQSYRYRQSQAWASSYEFRTPTDFFRSWELGTAAQALTEVYAPGLSVFNKTAFPPPSHLNSSWTPSEVFTIVNRLAVPLLQRVYPS